MIRRRVGHTLFPFCKAEFILSVFFVFILSGCSIIGPDSGSETARRTLPEALDGRRVSLEDARRTLSTPDTVTVEVYVVELAICPENWNCFLPDGIVIAESREPDDQEKTRRITVESPRQFMKGHHYLISLSVTDPSDRNVDENLFEIIGYSRAK
jgi:hypothetical protein